MTIQALPYVLLLGFLFGSTLVASRFSVGQYEPTTYIGLRLFLASLGYVAVYALVPDRRWPRDRHLWLHSILLGAIGTAVPMVAIVSALQYQSSGLTSVLITTGPAITVLAAHISLPDERLSRRKILGIFLALGGALLLALRGESGLSAVGQAEPLGYGLVLLGILVSSGTTIYVRKYMRSFDAFDVVSVRMFSATAVVMPLSLFFVGFDLSQVDVRGYAALGYAALIGTFAGQFLAFYNIQRFGATAAAMTSYVIPVAATLGGALLLAEQITTGMLGGMALIILGIAIINRRPRLLHNEHSSSPP